MDVTGNIADENIGDVFDIEIFIINAFDEFVKKHQNREQYDIDVFAVMDISRRYHKDDVRIKHFHKIPELDEHKKAGYLAYWIAKLKPIVIRDFDAYNDSPQKLRFINEVFAAYVGLGQIDCIKRRNGNGIPSGTITAGFVTSLLHTLKYRNTTGDNLSMVFYLVDELASVKTETTL